MSECKYVTLINGDQCIGDSLRTINENFSALEAGLCQESQRQFTASIDISAGDGLSVDVNQEGENFSFALNPENSLQYFRAASLEPSSTLPGTPAVKATLKAIPSNLNTQVTVMEVPWQQTPQVEPAKFSFETTSLGKTAPALTIYWLSSAQSSNIVYATNPNSLGLFNFNKAVRSITPLTLGNDSDYIFVAGDFTTARFKKSTTDFNYRIATVKLASGSQETEKGTQGAYVAYTDAIFGTGQTKILNILNTNPVAGAPTPRYGFNGNINKTAVATINGKKLLCVGGNFSGINNATTSTLLDGTTRGLVIFNLASPNVNPVEFVVNGSVYDLVVAGKYLYVCGNFTTANAVGVQPSEALSVFRVDLTNVAVNNSSPTTWIDSDFSANFNNSFINPIKPISRTINATQFVQCLAVDDEDEPTHLYVGGSHLRQTLSNGKPFTLNRGMTVHNLNSSRPGEIIDSWRYQFVGGAVRALNVNTIYNDVSPNNPLQTILLAGGAFTSVIEGTPVTAAEKKANTFTRKRIACFQLIDYDNFTGQILQGGNYLSSPLLNKEWYVDIKENAVLCFGYEDGYSNSPLYIGGNFKTVNGKSSNGNLAAISKPTQIAGRATLYPWNMNVNAPVYTIQTVASSSPMNAGITTPKTSLLIGGAFTKILGVPKNYLARVSCYNQVPVTVPLSSVVWEVAGSVLESGGSTEIVADTTMTQQNTANPIDCLNVTKFPPFTQGFETVTRGDLCRFVITRPLSTEQYADTYAKTVHVVGVSLDYNTQQVSPIDYPDVTIS